MYDQDCIFFYQQSHDYPKIGLYHRLLLISNKPAETAGLCGQFIDLNEEYNLILAWLLHNMPAHLILIPKNSFVMNAFEEREKKNLYAASKNSRLLVNQPPKELFKVVVNNYRQKEKSLDKRKKEIGETTMGHHQDLPLQPAGYLKFPKYDWF